MPNRFRLAGVHLHVAALILAVTINGLLSLLFLGLWTQEERRLAASATPGAPTTGMVAILGPACNWLLGGPRLCQR